MKTAFNTVAAWLEPRYRNLIIYIIHALVVLATAYLGYNSALFNWWMVALILAPLVLAIFNRYKDVSYTINVRILLPISIGLFFVSLYHYFPSVMADETSMLSKYGVQNLGKGIGSEFFQVNGLFKDAVTVLYAICVAFLLLKGLSDYDELKQVLYSEANEVRTISDFATYFMTSGEPVKNHPVVLELRQNLCAYLTNMLKGHKVITAEENEQVLEDCIVTVGNLTTKDKNDEVALAEIMHSVSKISSLRAQRTVCIQKRMSPFILVLVFLMSLTIVLSFFGSASQTFSIDYIYIFLLPTFYSSIFMTLIDLSTPFDGYWRIKLCAIEGVQQKLRRQIKRMTDNPPAHVDDTGVLFIARQP